MAPSPTSSISTGLGSFSNQELSNSLGWPFSEPGSKVHHRLLGNSVNEESVRCFFAGRSQNLEEGKVKANPDIPANLLAHILNLFGVPARKHQHRREGGGESADGGDDEPACESQRPPMRGGGGGGGAQPRLAHASRFHSTGDSNHTEDLG